MKKKIHQMRSWMVGGMLAGLSCHASDIVQSPRAAEFRHSIRRASEVAPDALFRGEISKSPRHVANQVKLAPVQVADRLPRGLSPMSPRAGELRSSLGR